MLFVLPEVFTLVLEPSFDLPCFLATAILDSVSLFYLPNRRIVRGPIASDTRTKESAAPHHHLVKYSVTPFILSLFFNVGFGDVYRQIMHICCQKLNVVTKIVLI